MVNYCTNCGTKLEDSYNFCTNCGTKIDKSDMGQNNPSLKSMPNSIEIKNAKKELKRVVGGILSYNMDFYNSLIDNGLDVHAGEAIKRQVGKEIESGQIRSAGVEFRVNQLIVEYKTRMEKEKEEKNKKIKTIDEIFESDEIKSQIRENNISQMYVNYIKDNLEDRLINKRENMSRDEIRDFAKRKLKKAAREQEKARIAKEKEMASKVIEKNKTRGGYCDYSCIHYYEEFLDGGGAIVGDFTSEGVVDHYCNLGHSLSYGSFCEYYER